MKKGILFAFVAALLIAPAAATASHTKSGKSAPKVMYVLSGQLSSYHAYNASTQTNGSITIAVSGANYHGNALKGQTLTFPVGASTSVSMRMGITQIYGLHGIVKVKAPKRMGLGSLAATLQAQTARQIVAQGAKSQ